MNCPSCWAKIEIEPWIVSYVCPYCKTISLFEHETLVSTGEKSEVTPFPTTLKYGKTFYVVKEKDSNNKIKWKNVEYLSEQEFSSKKTSYLLKFYVYAHIRYRSENGIYDKFFLRILDDELGLDRWKDLFIEEDEGQLKAYYLDFVEKDGTFDKIYNSNDAYVNWFFVQEKWIQQIEGFEWSFKFNIVWVKQTKYLNLINNWNFLLEEYPDKILFWKGV